MYPRGAIGPLRTQSDRLTIVANHRAVTVSSPPAEQAVSLEAAKAFMRITTTADDTRITSLIKACQNAVEGLTQRKLIAQTLSLQLDQFGDIYTPLTQGPVTGVTSVTVSGNLVDAADYRLIDESPELPDARLVANANGWPVPTNDFGDITILYTVGFADADAVPSGFKDAILWYVQAAYDDADAMMPKISKSILAPYIVVKV